MLAQLTRPAHGVANRVGLGRAAAGASGAPICRSSTSACSAPCTLPAKRKSLAIRFAELVVMYFIAGGVGLLLERRAGPDRAPGLGVLRGDRRALVRDLAVPGFRLALPV
jgi:hypothetical protein